MSFRRTYKLGEEGKVVSKVTPALANGKNIQSSHHLVDNSSVSSCFGTSLLDLPSRSWPWGVNPYQIWISPQSQSLRCRLAGNPPNVSDRTSQSPRCCQSSALNHSMSSTHSLQPVILMHQQGPDVGFSSEFCNWIFWLPIRRTISAKHHYWGSRGRVPPSHLLLLLINDNL